MWQVVTQLPDQETWTFVDVVAVATTLGTAGGAERAGIAHAPASERRSAGAGDQVALPENRIHAIGSAAQAARMRGVRPAVHVIDVRAYIVRPGRQSSLHCCESAARSARLTSRIS